MARIHHSFKVPSIYLSQCLQYAGVNGKPSSATHVISELPRESVLGPPFYVDDIELSDGSLLLYADDVFLYKPVMQAKV